VARYGGEEFIIMLAGAGEKGAVEVGEKIRAGLQEKKFKFGKDTYSTTISAGVAEFSKEAAKEELVARADKALYRAKQEGKNRVISCDS
jgi:diguanylate cyclase (GGDEF)-like protein